jgi:hypothetical protein
MARENDVHRALHANGTLELPATAPDGAAVLHARKLGVHVAGEKRLLHDSLSIVNRL